MGKGFGWNYEDFCEFYELLTLPDGRPARLEGFQRLILRFIFAGLVELLVLIPKGQAKTTLMAALAVYHLLVTPNANCYIGAATKVQADEMYRFASHFVDSEPEIAALARVLDGTKSIRSLRDKGFIKVLASDDSKQGGKAQGFNPTLALIDELHAHENPNLYIDMRTGLFKRKGLLVVITTAGWDLEGVLGTLRASFFEAEQNGGTVESGLVADDRGGYYYNPEAGRLTVAQVGKSAMLEWALRDKQSPLVKAGVAKVDDPDDLEVVKLANPASWVTIESLEDARTAPGITPWIFRRYRANLWTLAFESWLPDGAWAALQHSGVHVVQHKTWLGAEPEALDRHVASLFSPGEQLAGAVDMARYRDCAAVTFIGPGPDGRRVPRSVIWRSGGPKQPVPYEPIKRVIRKAEELYTLSACGYDPKYFDESGTDLYDEGIPMEQFPQSQERMCAVADKLYRDIITEKAFAHDGDPILSAHVQAAIGKDVGDGQFRLVKSKENGPPIDGCISLGMANELHGYEAVEPLGAWG